MGPRQEHFRMFCALRYVWANKRLYCVRCANSRPAALAERSGSLLSIAARDTQPPPRHRPHVDEPPGRDQPARHKAGRNAAPEFRRTRQPPGLRRIRGL